MPCEVWFKINISNYTHSDPDKDKTGVYKKGYPVNMLDFPRVHRGYKEGLPDYCAINIIDANIIEVEAMVASIFSGKSLIQEWIRKIDFATVNNNATIDGWRIRVFATNPGFSNKAGITQLMVENYLTKWNAVVHSTTTNEVQFDVAVYEDGSSVPGAIQSEGFWGLFPINVSFTETSYVEEAGVHTVEADYSLSIFFSEQVQNCIEDRGGVVISDVSEVVTFTINRTDVFQWFQQEVREAIERTIYRRQFRIPEVAIDTIISTGTQILIDHYWDDEQTQFRGQVEYRVLDRTLAQVEAFLINRLDEDL